MPSQTLTPTTFVDLGSWLDEFLAVGGTPDGYGAYNTGAGYLSLRQMSGRLNLPGNSTPVGFEVELWGRTNGPTLVNDTFTDTPGTWLHNHDGELNADWRRPFTGADPSYQGINSSGRTYYGFENDSGPTTNGAEHFLNQYTPPSADYAVEARIFAATDGGTGEKAEIYARATTPHTFYFLAYQEGTNTWELGIMTGAGTRTVLGSYVGDDIAPGTSKLCRLECRGTSIKGFIDGSERISVTNGTITGAGYPGLRLDAGASRTPSNSVITTALYDLGSAQTVTRVRRRFGNVNLNSYTLVIEGSSDGVNWTDAYTGSPLLVGFPACTFAWEDELDIPDADITNTAYRYWRVACIDTDDGGCPPDSRISDFRLYVAGNLVVPDQITTIARGAYRNGVTPHNWSEATNTLLTSDGSPADTTTWIGGTATSGTISQEGLQFDSFRVLRLLPTTLNVYLSANGSTPTGSAKTLLLTADSTYRLIGSPSDLWNGSWTIVDVRGDNFAILLERAESLAEAWVDSARVIIYYATNGGSLMALREKVRQQITIGREVGVNAVQTLTVTGTPTGGTFRLTFNGIETAPIAFNASAFAVQAALEAIISIGTGGVVCGGVALPGSAVTITFQGALAATPVNLITVTNAAFTGGSSPAGSVANTTTGVRAPGNGVAANVRLRHARIQPQPAPEFMDHRPAGEKLINHQLVLKEASEGPIEGIPTYDEMGWLLQGLIARPNSSVLVAGANRHVFALDNRTRDGISTYTAEYGDPSSRTHKIAGMIVNALNLAFRSDGIDLGGSIIAQQLQDGVTPSLGVATVQTVTQSGSGNFRLRLRGQETADLAAGAGLAAATVETALRALPFVNSSTALTVSGAAGGPFTVTFANTAGQPFQGNPQPLLESRITSGTPVVSIAMTTRGGFTDYPGQVILPRHLEVFLSPTLAGIASAKLTDVFATGFSMGNRAAPVYNLDRSSSSWFAYAEPSNLDVGLNMIAQAQSPAMQFLAQARSDTILYLRLLATGPLIGTTAFPHRLQIDVPVKVSKFGPFSENQEVYAFEYNFTAAQDDGTNTNLVVTLDNGVTNYN